MKIESGKFYKTRNGQKVLIYATGRKSSRPIHGVILDGDNEAMMSWADGGFTFESKTEFGYDIVAEWEEEGGTK